MRKEGGDVGAVRIVQERRIQERRKQLSKMSGIMAVTCLGGSESTDLPGPQLLLSLFYFIFYFSFEAGRPLKDMKTGY